MESKFNSHSLCESNNNLKTPKNGSEATETLDLSTSSSYGMYTLNVISLILHKTSKKHIERESHTHPHTPPTHSALGTQTNLSRMSGNLIRRRIL